MSWNNCSPWIVSVLGGAVITSFCTESNPLRSTAAGFCAVPVAADVAILLNTSWFLTTKFTTPAGLSAKLVMFFAPDATVSNKSLA